MGNVFKKTTSASGTKCAATEATAEATEATTEAAVAHVETDVEALPPYITLFRASAAAAPAFYDLDDTGWVFTISHVRKYRSFDAFLQSGVAVGWAHAECTVEGVRKFHPDVRFVYKCQETVTLHSSALTAFMKANDLEKVGPVDFLKYDAGCFAAKHVDRMGEFTCLVFPKMSASTGGELRLFADNGTVVVEPNKLVRDTMVIFSTNVEHEVLPVTSGERYVFKVGLAKAAPVHMERVHRRFNCNRD